MTISLFDIFKIGIGPSSSHTVGPMKAAARFVSSVTETGNGGEVRRVAIELFGSLALTGLGHGTDTALILGLAGAAPETVDPDDVARIVALVRATGTLPLGGGASVSFSAETDIVMRGNELLPRHVNGMRFSAFGADGSCQQTAIYYSIGGGFIVGEDEVDEEESAVPPVQFPYPFKSSADLLAMGEKAEKSVAEIALANERALRSEDEIFEGLRRIWRVMSDGIRRGMSAEGQLPGPLGVPRRAGTIHKTLRDRVRHDRSGPLEVLDWVNLFAIAVNEENAAGGRVVTAPTNGAAGIIPAVGSYFERFCEGADEAGIFTFLLTAGAIGG
ncbi:MAG: L-serine ammonia-lyase, partial [Rhodospirillales bacterium]|nr:L-serine ammonia-lyase [Rhodospirillales bacterium]